MIHDAQPVATCQEQEADSSWMTSGSAERVGVFTASAAAATGPVDASIADITIKCNLGPLQREHLGVNVCSYFLPVNHVTIIKKSIFYIITNILTF